MLTRRNKVILISFLIYSLLHWAFFFTVFFGYHDVFTSTRTPYMDLPVQEQELLRRNIGDYKTLTFVIAGVDITSILAYQLAMYSLLRDPIESKEQPVFLIDEKYRAAISWIPLLLFAVLLIYLKFSTERYYLWVEMFPFMIPSVEFLTVAAAGLCTLRKRRISEADGGQVHPS